MTESAQLIKKTSFTLSSGSKKNILKNTEKTRVELNFCETKLFNFPSPAVITINK